MPRRELARGEERWREEHSIPKVMCQVPYLSAQSSSLPESFSRSRTSLGAAKARLCFSPLLVSHTLQCPVHGLLHISDPLSSHCPGSVLSTMIAPPTRGTSSVPPQLILSFTELLPKTIVLSLLCSRVLFLSLIFITFIYWGGGVHVYQRMHAEDSSGDLLLPLHPVVPGSENRLDSLSHPINSFSL